MFKLLRKAIKKHYLILPVCWQKCSKFIKSDKLFLKVYYRLCLGRKLDFDNPRSFTEKIQWLKLYNTSPLCTQLVDKYAVREYVKNRIGSEHLVPLLGVWDSFKDIDFNKLPDRFVLKTTHDSGGVVICRDKKKLNFEQAQKVLTGSLKRNYFWKGREYPYKNVKPRIIAEKFMEGEDRGYLVDFKFFCFNGVPKVLFFASNRYNAEHTPPRFDYYDMEMNHLPVRSKGHDNAEKRLSMFPEYLEMQKIAAVLSQGFPHVRVDLFMSKGKIFFGEMTFHHDGGFVPFIPDEWDYKFGEMINLPK
jgi:hypothetical protein